MADGVEFTQDDYDVAMRGLKIQLSTKDCLIINDANFQDFLDNTARVIACERAYSRMLQNTLHDKVFKQ